jgi:HK97 family phage major capsid protein
VRFAFPTSLHAASGPPAQHPDRRAHTVERLNALLQDLRDIDARLDELLAHDELTDEQRAEHANLVARREKSAAAYAEEKDRLSRQQEREKFELEAQEAEARAAEQEAKRKAVEERQKRLAAPMPGANRITKPETAQPLPARREDAEPEKFTVPASAKRFGSVRNFRGVRHGLTAEERAYRFGMCMMSVLAQQLPNRYGHLKGAQEWVKKHAAAVGSNDASGYQFLIQPEFASDIVDLREQFGVARRLLRVVPMMSDTKMVPRREGGLTAYAVGENSAGTESNKTWDEVMLTARKWMVISRASKEVNEDLAVSWGDDLAEEIAYAFAEKEDDCAFNGDGTSTYHGIVGIRTKLQSVDGAGTDSAGLVTGTGNLWSELTLNDHIGVIAKLPQYADTAAAVWVCHKTYYHNVMQKVELAAGGVTAREISDGDRRPRPLFLGYPVEFSQKFPSSEANSQVTAILGDLRKGAAFGDRRQETIEFSDQAYVNGQSLWERDQIGIKGTERMDIVVHDVGSSSASGPIVGLQTAAS